MLLLLFVPPYFRHFLVLTTGPTIHIIMLFNTWDPRHLNVVLYERTYEHHIVARHGDEISVADIQQTIKNPDIIAVDEVATLVEIYYARGVVASADPAEYLKDVLILMEKA